MRWKTTEYTGWGRAAKAKGDIARPERLSAVERCVSETPAPAFGMRRSYGDACLNNGGRAIDTTRLDRILSFDPETGEVAVEAGMTLGDLLGIFAPKGWLPPVMPGTGFATVGGAIGMDVHGKNHHCHGSFGQHITAMTLVTPEGTQNLTPEDPLFRATMGGIGQTGIVTRATIRLLKRKGDVMVVTERRARNWDEHIALLDASDATYNVGWIDATATGPSLGRGILEEAETGGGLVPAPKKAKRIRTDAPHFALSPIIVRNFNKLYYSRVPAKGRTLVKPIDLFFFPLDKIHDWNRLYGKRGFHQFQCVVPLSAAPQLRSMVTEIATSGLASPLAVLKRMGPGRAGMLSFPMEGYTLAVDFPNRESARTLIARLEAMARDAGGRIYLAKDALATGPAVKAMYPEYEAWSEIVETIDPKGAFATDMTRRLNLRKASQ